MVQLNMKLHGVTASGTGITHSGSSSDLKGVKTRITQGMDGSAQHEFAWSNCIWDSITHSGSSSDLKGVKVIVFEFN